MEERNEKGQFLKGLVPWNKDKKSGHTPWNKGKKGEHHIYHSDFEKRREKMKEIGRQYG